MFVELKSSFFSSPTKPNSHSYNPRPKQKELLSMDRLKSNSIKFIRSLVRRTTWFLDLKICPALLQSESGPGCAGPPGRTSSTPPGTAHAVSCTLTAFPHPAPSATPTRSHTSHPHACSVLPLEAPPLSLLRLPQSPAAVGSSSPFLRAALILLGNPWPSILSDPLLFCSFNFLGPEAKWRVANLRISSTVAGV